MIIVYYKKICLSIVLTKKIKKFFRNVNLGEKWGEKKRLQVDKRQKNAYNIYNEEIKRKKEKVDRADGRER